jgi:hypothetical protein
MHFLADVYNWREFYRDAITESAPEAGREKVKFARTVCRARLAEIRLFLLLPETQELMIALRDLDVFEAIFSNGLSKLSPPPLAS